MLALGRSSYAGHTARVTEEELHVHLTRGQVSGQLPTAGAELELRLLLPDQLEPVPAPGRLLWVNPDEKDPTGRPVMGVGVRITDPAAAARLAAYVRDFVYTVMLVEPHKRDQGVTRDVLEADYRVLACGTAAEAFALLASKDVSAVIVNERLPDCSSVDFVQRASELRLQVPVPLIVSHAEDVPQRLQELIELGKVFYYLRKPFRPSDLKQVVLRAVGACALALENQRLNAELERVNQRLQRENVFLRRRLQVYQGFNHVIGESPELRRAFADLEAVRQTNTTVHIQGETGTGKELVARALHFGGVRAKGPFVAQNCAGMSESLLQSTLFGHKKGSFTGAVRDHAGVFEQAHGGTLFLDEVAELPLAVQGALLRALQEGEITPLGTTTPIEVDVRVVSATHADLREEVRKGRFREDLYFRLVVLSIRVPALRERGGDVPLLARHFLSLHCQHHGKKVGDITPEAMRTLERYSWPGNVRELENEIERLVVLIEDGGTIDLDLVSPHIRQHAEATAGDHGQGDDAIIVPRGFTYDQSVELLERTLIERALARSRGNVSAAAQLLGMERSRLGKLRTRLGVSVGEGT